MRTDDKFCDYADRLKKAILVFSDDGEHLEPLAKSHFSFTHKSSVEFRRIFSDEDEKIIFRAMIMSALMVNVEDAPAS